jgi:hypothetical protein
MSRTETPDRAASPVSPPGTGPGTGSDVPAGPRPPMPRGPFAAVGMPAEKSLNFGPSAR